MLVGDKKPVDTGFFDARHIPFGNMCCAFPIFVDRLSGGRHITWSEAGLRSYIKINGSALPKGVGVDEGDLRVSDGNAGNLSFGPYIDLSAGKYSAAFYIRRRNAFDLGHVFVDVAARRGELILASMNYPIRDIMRDIAGLVKIDFALARDETDVEVRLNVGAEERIEIWRLVIFRRDLDEWITL